MSRAECLAIEKLYPTTLASFYSSTFPEMNFSASGVFAYMSILFGFVVAIIWLRIGWRAMRAHERLADAADRATRAHP
jgi:uncharacterized membrane protein